MRGISIRFRLLVVIGLIKVIPVAAITWVLQRGGAYPYPHRSVERCGVVDALQAHL